MNLKMFIMRYIVKNLIIKKVVYKLKFVSIVISNHKFIIKLLINV
jgi:hypothetical protein